MAFYNTTLSQSLDDRYYKYSEIREIYRNQTNQINGFGSNVDGQLGNNTNINAPLSQPVTVGGNWIRVATGAHSVAIRYDGTLWAWGFNSSGQLGLNDVVPRSSPVQVGSSKWSQVSSGYYFTTAIRSDSTLWAMGFADKGELGNNSTIHRSSPVQIGTSSWTSVSSGGYTSLAIRSDGTLWGWGRNVGGNLGVGDTSNRSSPVQVGTSTWMSTAVGDGDKSYAIRSDNTLWSWGFNDVGALGDNTTISRSSPVQITADNGVVSFTQVDGGENHALAIDVNGWLYAWGSNTNGQLGSGTTVHRSQPTLISTSANFTRVFAASDTSFGLRADGTLWWWGRDMPDGTNYRSSPVQLNSTIYRTIGLAGSVALAIKE